MRVLLEHGEVFFLVEVLAELFLLPPDSCKPDHIQFSENLNKNFRKSEKHFRKSETIQEITGKVIAALLNRDVLTEFFLCPREELGRVVTGHWTSYQAYNAD